MKNLLSISFIFTILALSLFCSSSAVGQKNDKSPKIPNLKIAFDKIEATKLDAQTDEKIETWQTTNKCFYRVNRKFKFVSFIEFTENDERVKAWRFEITEFKEDNEVYIFFVNDDEGTERVIIWKDKSMVVIEDLDYIYLVSGWDLEMKN